MMTTSLESNSKCAVLVPVVGAIEPQCEQGLKVLEKHGYHVQRVQGFTAIDLGRSFLASAALASGYHEIMWIDSDIGFDPDDVDKLRGHGLPFCCGVYPKKAKLPFGESVNSSAQAFTCKFLPGTEQVKFGKDGGLIEIINTGFGFVYTRCELYEAIKSANDWPECKLKIPNEPLARFFIPPAIIPFFIPELANEDLGWQYLTEDLAFCRRARSCGFKIMADTSVRLTHIGRYAFTWEDVLNPQKQFATNVLNFKHRPKS
jgi:hypothetical protein